MSRITANQLRKHYRGRLALRGVSFTVSPGEIFAYLGPNGAGKTTTIRLLTGLARPSAGQALIDGHDPLREPAAKRRVGVVAQTINLDQELTVAQNLDIHGRLFGLPGPCARAEPGNYWPGSAWKTGPATWSCACPADSSAGS